MPRGSTQAGIGALMAGSAIVWVLGTRLVKMLNVDPLLCRRVFGEKIVVEKSTLLRSTGKKHADHGGSGA